MRDDSRRGALLDSLESRQTAQVELDDEVNKRLIDPSANRSYERARKLLSN